MTSSASECQAADFPADEWLTTVTPAVPDLNLMTFDEAEVA
jgi:hypothetical protein